MRDDTFSFFQQDNTITDEKKKQQQPYLHIKLECQGKQQHDVPKVCHILTTPDTPCLFLAISTVVNRENIKINC